MAGILTNQQVQFYREQGYLLVEELFDKAEVELARQAIEEILDRPNPTSVAEAEPDDPTVFRRIWSPTKRHKFFEAMVCDNRILDRVENLIGSNIVFHYSKINMKSAKVGSAVELHQDLSYYPHTNTNLVSCLIYLDDATSNNGCLQVIPGSHQNKILDHYIGGYFRGKLSESLATLDLRQSVSCEAPSGSAIFLHCLTVHYSLRNHSNKPRRTFISAYKAADAYPIYFGSHVTRNESSTKLLRGQRSNVAKMESGIWQLPLVEAEYNSIYEIQEGSHLNTSKNSVTDNYTDVRRA